MNEVRLAQLGWCEGARAVVKVLRLCLQQESFRFILECVIKRYDRQARGQCKGCEVRIRPILWGWMGQSGQTAEMSLKPSGLIQELHSIILEPPIIGFPRLFLGHYFVATHDCYRSQEPQQPQLRKPAEE